MPSADTEDKEFIQEMKQLCEKHKVRMVEYDNYDGNGDYAGESYYFSSTGSGGIFMGMDDLKEALEAKPATAHPVGAEGPVCTCSYEESEEATSHSRLCDRRW